MAEFGQSNERKLANEKANILGADGVFSVFWDSYTSYAIWDSYSYFIILCNLNTGAVISHSLFVQITVQRFTVSNL